jgi:uncharacterized protein YqhQ
MSENGHTAPSSNGNGTNPGVNSKGEIKFSYGGQAVIEGVMMRGAHTAAIAVRNPQGQIVVHEQPLNATLYRGRIAKTPFVRGVVGLWDALGLGTRALMWAADVAIAEEDEDEKINFNGPIGWVTIAFSLLLGVGLFFLLPTTAATGLGRLLGLSHDGSAPIGVNAFLINLIEGFIQLGILIGYIWLIGRIPDVKRLFGYHGAEHKTINAYEAGAELTPEVVSKYPIEHPRCGTAFLLTVVFVSVFVFSLLGRPPFLLLILSRIIFIPVIAGIAYELLRWTARNNRQAQSGVATSDHPPAGFAHDRSGDYRLQARSGFRRHVGARGTDYSRTPPGSGFTHTGWGKERADADVVYKQVSAWAQYSAPFCYNPLFLPRHSLQLVELRQRF